MGHKLKEKTHILVISALGVVFGGIGTSPLYAVKVCFTGNYAITPSPANVLGLISLIFWSLSSGREYQVCLIHHARRR
jgi:KUP system potassium uptake protein